MGASSGREFAPEGVTPTADADGTLQEGAAPPAPELEGDDFEAALPSDEIMGRAPAPAQGNGATAVAEPPLETLPAPSPTGAPVPPVPPAPTDANLALDEAEVEEIEAADEDDDDDEPEAMEEVEDALDERDATLALDSMLRLGHAPKMLERTYNMGLVAERLRDEGIDVERFPVRLRGLLEQEITEISERAVQEPTKAERKKGIQVKQDRGRFMRLMVLQSLIYPDPHDPRLISTYQTAENVLRHWFLAGEIEGLFDKVNDLSGWAANSVELAKK